MEQRKQCNDDKVLGQMEQLAEDRPHEPVRSAVDRPGQRDGAGHHRGHGGSVAGAERGLCDEARRAADVADMRTWPLQFALGEAAIFAIIFSGIAAWAGDSPALVAAASGVAACLAVGVAQLLAGRGGS